MRAKEFTQCVFIILQVCHNTSNVCVIVTCSSFKKMKLPYKHFICVQVVPESVSFSHVLLLMVHHF